MHHQVPAIHKIDDYKHGLAIAGIEMKGLRPTMEDRMIIQNPLSEQRIHQHTSLYAIFDGHGGVDCANFIADRIVTSVSQLPNPHDDNSLKAMMIILDGLYLQEFKTSLAGTTCLIAIVSFPFSQQAVLSSSNTVESKQETGIITLINLGDSRSCIIKKAGTNNKCFQQITTDHKPNNLIESTRIKKANCQVTETQGIFRIDYGLSVSRALGDRHYKRKESSFSPYEQPVSCMPDIFHLQFEVGDILVLFCDGFIEGHFRTNEYVLEPLAQFVAENKNNTKPSITGEAWSQQLLHSTVQSIRDGSQDNHSILIVHYRGIETKL